VIAKLLPDPALNKNKTLYGALTRWGYTKRTLLHVYDTYSTELSGKGKYERERLNTLKCGTHRTLQIKLPAFMPTSKVIFYSTLHSSVGRQFKTSKLEYFGAFGLKILSK
jgi:hypothetical protein